MFIDSSKINNQSFLCVGLDKTVNELTRKGCLLHLTIKPLCDTYCKTVSTKLAFFKSRQILDK
jgi:hypothetical protein